MVSIDPRNIGPLLDSYNRVSGGVIFVECIKCGFKCDIKLDNIEEISNREAMRYFCDKGWTIKPTICPKCIRAQTKDDKEGD